MANRSRSGAGEVSATNSTAELLRRGNTTTFTRPLVRRKVLLLVAGLCLGITLILGLSIGFGLRSSTVSEQDFLPIQDIDNVEQPFRHEDYGQPDVGFSPDGAFAHAAVTSDAGRCSKIGSDILARNGSAVDAAIATQLCLGLFVPQSMGLGGGLFMTVYHRASGRSYVVDAREEAPGAATDNMFGGNPNISQKGPLAAAVPGELRGLELAHRMFGRLPWEELFLPSIELCKTGVPVERALASAIKQKKSNIFADPGLKSVFVNPATGDVYKLNDIITYPQLAETLTTISKEGADALYKGTLGQNIIDELQALGGIMTMTDLNNYSARLKNATAIGLRDGMRMFGVPPPASGIILSNIMLVLDGYNFRPSDLDTDNASVELHHRMDEAFKFAYARRSELGDEAFVDQTELIDNLTSPDYAAYVRSRIWDNRTFDASYYGADYDSLDDHGTSHMTVVSPDGDAVAITSTINLYFGCGIMSPSTGIILNDEMDDFSSPNVTNYFNVRPSVNNYIVPGKRPVSSMTPTIFVDANGDVALATGGSGGTKITTSVTYSAIRHLWLGNNVTQSVDARRIHNQLYPETTEYEKGFPQVIIDGMAAMGHNMTIFDSTSIVNPIGRTTNGYLHPVADIRKGGNVSGF